MSNGEKLCCPFIWNCLFVSNQGAFIVSRVSGRSLLVGYRVKERDVISAGWQVNNV